jgi:uncharacterized protein with GYD domain
MPLYLTQASYKPEGVKGLIKDGGTARVAAVRDMLEKLGGTLHAFYFTYGVDDAVLITEFPDRTGALAVSLAVNASGATSCRQTELITPAELDAATRKVVAYRAPGA